MKPNPFLAAMRRIAQDMDIYNWWLDREHRREIFMRTEGLLEVEG